MTYIPPYAPSLPDWQRQVSNAFGPTITKAGETVSVKTDGGALGDGQSDDTAAIQRADALATSKGATLYFPAGIYIVSPSGVSMGGASWRGDGRDLSIIRSKAATWSNLQALVTASSKNNFSVSRIGFDLGPGTFPAGTGNPGNIYAALQLTTCNDWRVSDCAFTGIQAQTIGTSVNGGLRFSISDNYYLMPTPSGSYNQAINISVSGGAAQYYTVSRNLMNGTALFSNGSYGTVCDNRVMNWKFGGGLTFGPNSGQLEHLISGNHCISGAGTDINSANPTGIESWSPYSTIIGNICYGNAGDGIGGANNGGVIANNVCLNNGQVAGSGINLVSSQVGGVNYVSNDCIVVGNLMFDTQTTHTQSYGYNEVVNAPAPAPYNVHVHSNKIGDQKTGIINFAASSFHSFTGPQHHGSATVNPGTIAANSTFSTSVVCTGARPGDLALVGYSGAASGVVISGNVDANDNVNCKFANLSGAGVTLGSATVNVCVLKPPSYTKYW